MNWGNKTMYKIIFFFVFSLFVSCACACGDNSNAIVQGPFRTDLYSDGLICFQSTSDKRDIEFFVSYMKEGISYNKKVDTFYYSDAPVELMSVFFVDVSGSKNVFVLLRWNVNYESDGSRYTYYYEIKSYKKNQSGYVMNLSGDNDPNLSGYQIVKNNKIIDFPLNDANKIKKYLKNKYK